MIYVGIDIAKTNHYASIVNYSTGEVIENSNETKQVISDATAYMITDVLKDVAAKERLMRSYKYNITDNLIKRDSYYNLIEEEIIFLKSVRFTNYFTSV